MKKTFVALSVLAFAAFFTAALDSRTVPAKTGFVVLKSDVNEVGNQVAYVSTEKRGFPSRVNPFIYFFS